ncbi:LIM domain only protein 7-like [Osmerus eperlanus]|uniref:LIM domain only protein 7-like n=1 Tax=Osmerus eperlanus TaxID=29151 RepID=UPI002E0FFED7
MHSFPPSFLSFLLLFPAAQTCSPHTHPHTAPQQTPKPPTPLLERPPLVFSRVDPSSGPRLVRGERRALLGRHDPLEAPEPWEVGDAVLPDLENDDMFARRTQAFHSNSDLALMKTSGCKSQSCSPEPEVNIVTQPSRPGDSRRPRLPDIQRDDVLYRKVNPQQAQRPLSGDPERYTPLHIPEPWALPPSLQARLMCPPCPLNQEVPSEDQNERKERPKTDDMLLRKFGVGAQGQGSPLAKSANQMTPSVPTSCSEGDLQKMQEIREASRLRFRKRLLVERLAFLNS